jgi:hypothetical protein
VSSDAARLLLARLGLSPLDGLHLALGAFDDVGVLIGVLAAGPVAASGTTVWVAVTPECRRLRVATDLLETLIFDYADAIGAQLVFQHPEKCPVAVSFIESVGLTARRLAPDRTAVTLH